MKIYMLPIFVLFYLSFAINKNVVVVSKMVEIKKSPADSSVTVFMAQSDDMFQTLRSQADSSGMVWFLILFPKHEKIDSGWIRAKDIRYMQDSIKAQTHVLELKHKREDKKRRLEYIKKHPEWPRRIKTAIHNGEICIYMTKEQMEASWGKPDMMGTGYMIGVGHYEIAYYLCEVPIIITLENGCITGWSEKITEK